MYQAPDEDAYGIIKFKLTKCFSTTLGEIKIINVCPAIKIAFMGQSR